MERRGVSTLGIAPVLALLLALAAELVAQICQLRPELRELLFQGFDSVCEGVGGLGTGDWGLGTGLRRVLIIYFRRHQMPVALFLLARASLEPLHQVPLRERFEPLFDRL